MAPGDLPSLQGRQPLSHMALEKEQGLLFHQPLHGRKPWAGAGAGVAGLREADSKNTSNEVQTRQGGSRTLIPAVASPFLLCRFFPTNKL